MTTSESVTGIEIISRQLNEKKALLEKLKSEIKSLEAVVAHLSGITKGGISEVLTKTEETKVKQAETVEPVIPKGGIKQLVRDALMKIPLGEFTDARVKEIIYKEYPELRIKNGSVNTAFTTLVSILMENGMVERTGETKGMQYIYEKLDSFESATDF